MSTNDATELTWLDCIARGYQPLKAAEVMGVTLGEAYAKMQEIRLSTMPLRSSWDVEKIERWHKRRTVQHSQKV